MNFSKSILSLALLVSVSAASAFPGESLFSKEAISFRYGQAKDLAASVWAKVPSRTDVSETFAAKAYDVKQVVAPYKKAAAITAVTGAVVTVVTGSVVAYKKGYFGKAAQAVVNFGSAVKAKFAAKK